MNSLFRAATKPNSWVWICAAIGLYSWVWICAAIGLFFVIIEPSHWVGWVLLNIVLFQIITLLIIIPHELGHALAAHVLGVRAIQIIIGSGHTLFTFQWIGMTWEVKQFPLGGITSISIESTHFYRLRMFFIVLFGPLTNILLFFFALQLPQEIFLRNPPGTYLFPGLIFYFSNAITIVANLFPHYDNVVGIRLPSDGLQMITIPFLSKQAIAQRVALSLVVDAQNCAYRGNYTQAIERCNQAIETDRDCILAYQSRGAAYKDIEEYNRAFDDFNQAIKLDPQNAISYWLRGDAYHRLGYLDPTNFQAAIQDLSQAIRLSKVTPIDPDLEASFYLSRAASYSYVCDEAQAIEDFTRVIQLNPSTDSYYNRGVVHYQHGNYQEALEDLNQAIRFNSKNVSAYYNRGNTKYELQDTSGAFQDYDVAASFELSGGTVVSEDEHGFYARGIAHIRLEDWTNARQDLQAAERLCAKHGNVYLLQRVKDEITKIPDAS